MTLDLPTVSVTLGPVWASELNAAFNVVDLHDHSPGKGVRVTPAGLNINADLSIGSNNLNNINSSRYINNAGTLTDPADIRSVYVVGGDLYYNNGAGTPVQITSGTSVQASTTGESRAYESNSIAANTVINPSDTYSFIQVDTSSSVQITLPSAAAVANGRFYVIKDVIGLANTNNISILPAGADTIDGTASTSTIDVNFASVTLVSDGSSDWSFMEAALDVPGDIKTPNTVTAGVFNLFNDWSIEPNGNSIIQFILSGDSLVQFREILGTREYLFSGNDGIITLCGQNQTPSNGQLPGDIFLNTLVRAWSKTSSAGTALDGANISVNKPSTGIYDYTFITPRANGDDDYAVLVTCMGGTNGRLGVVGNISNTGFRVSITNTSSGSLDDETHSVVVVG